MKFCYVIPKMKVNDPLGFLLFIEEEKFVKYEEEEQAINLFLTRIREKGFYINRDFAENEPDYLQVIPIIVIRYPGGFVLYQRKNKHSEQRLANKWTCAFGGHIDPEDFLTEKKQVKIINSDVKLPNMINSCIHREIEEETGIDINSVSCVSFSGVLFDPRDAVGKVHLGLIFEIFVQNENKVIDKIKTMEEIGDACPVSLENMKKELEGKTLEGWANIILSKGI